MRKKLLFIVLCLLSQWTLAQKEAPKWVDKAKKAVFSVVTYDANNKLLNTGNGFFVSEDGVALSDYTLFKGAARAEIINFEGKQMPVKAILGANNLYDVIKFRVDLGKKSTSALTIAAVVPAKDADAVMLPYSTKKDRSCTMGKVDEVSNLAGPHKYFKLAMAMKEKQISCPVLNAEGEVFGLIQKDASNDATHCYAISAPFVNELSVGALDFSNSDLNSIGIKKALPAKEDQALVALFMASSQVKADKYLDMLNDFVEQFPNNTDGYIRRANFYAANYTDAEHLKLAEEDLDKALKISDKKDDILYNRSSVIYEVALRGKEVSYKDWNFDKALQEIQKAEAINPLPVYYQHEGNVYFAMTNYAKAFECFQKVNQSKMSSAQTFFSAAKAKEMMNGDLGEIIALLDSAVGKYAAPYPKEAAPYLSERAVIKGQKGMDKEAVADYDLYYQAMSGSVSAMFYYLREQSNYKSKNFKRALEDIQKAVELDSSNKDYLAEYGAVNLRIARYDDAIKNLKDALVIDPKFAACYRLIGFCQMQQGKKAEACENFSKAKELGDEAVLPLIEKNCK
jgi:hypothetical protein